MINLTKSLKQNDDTGGCKIVYNKQYGGYIVSGSNERVASGWVDSEMFEKIATMNPEEAAHKLVDLSLYKTEEDADNSQWELHAYADYERSDTRLKYFVYLSKTYNGQDDSSNLKNGAYHMTTTDNGQILAVPYSAEASPVKIVSPKGVFDNVKSFFSKEASKIRRNKSGMLLYGPPGNGKTSEIMEVIRGAAELDAVVFVVSASVRMNSLEAFRKAMGGRKTVFIIEELTERAHGQNVESLLSFLDGENSWNNAISIATTNYPKELPENIIDRPGRFDTFIAFNNPSNEQISELAKTIGFGDEDDITPLFGEKLSFDYVSFILAKAIEKTGNDRVAETLNAEANRRRFFSETFKQKTGIR